MDRVCYILGAGFSAPLGLPLMSTFRTMSEDMVEAEPNRFGYFKEVFENIGQMSVAKNYFRADLTNIEEIFSILEMQSFLDKVAPRESFTRYIKDVIQHCTPPLEPVKHPTPSNWQGHLFGIDERWKGYGVLVAAIVNAVFRRQETEFGSGKKRLDIVMTRRTKPTTAYSVVTLNYDRVLEQMLEFISNEYPSNEPPKFNHKAYDQTWSQPHLAKLHGSTDSDIVVLPTWRKGTHNGIAGVWQQACSILADATRIRFIGYSLPASDAYVRYLLKAASLKATRQIKGIDVICLDGDGTVRKAYDDFIEGKYRFANAKTEAYLEYLTLQMMPSVILQQEESVRFDKLELAHDEFMRQHAKP